MIWRWLKQIPGRVYRTTWILRRLFCFFTDHRRGTIERDMMKHMSLVHLCVDAGCRFTCQRCGYHWDDLSREARRYFDSKERT